MKKRQNSNKAQTNAGGYSGTVEAEHLDSQDLSSAFMSDADRKAGAYRADSSSAVATLEAPIEVPISSGGSPVVASENPAEAQNAGFNKSNGNSHSSNGGNGSGHGHNNGGNHSGHNGSHGHSGHGSGGREHGQERRRRRRALISAPVRVRSLNITEEGPSEVTTTIDVSRGGIFFVSELTSYEKHMEVAVVFPFSGIPGDVHAEQMGHIVRVVEYEDGRRGIAVSFEKPAVVTDEALVDSGGRQLQPYALRAPGLAGTDASAAIEQKEVKVLILEADSRARESMSSYLGSEGYSPLTAASGAKAREVLATNVPAVVIADVEGDSMAGFDICAFIKSDERLRHVHVILVTSSAYPSDYANAHAVGATICMAKPFKQEKLGQMVKLLAPPRRLTVDKSAARATPEQGSSANGNGAAKRPMVSTLSSNGYTKPVVPTPAPAADQHEFRKLCDAAVNEKRVRDGDRYDVNDTDQTVGASKDAKNGESKGGFAAFRNKAASLFKR
jgi:CheY-like chemotaxis protein